MRKGLDKSIYCIILPNFPLLVCFDHNDFNYANADPEGLDIRFVDEDGTTRLPHEIEDWNPPTGTSYVWVRANIEYTGDDFIWMYYGYAGGGPVPAPLDPPEDVWSYGYAAVYHMVDATSSLVLDSTANVNDGTKGDVGEPTDQPGKIYRGQDFDGSNDYIDCGDIDSDVFDGSNDALTAEAWVWVDTPIDPYRMVISKYNSEVSPDHITFYVNVVGQKLRALASVDGDTEGYVYSTTDADFISTGGWYHVAAVIDLGSEIIRLYVNGVERASTKFTVGTPPTVFADNDTPVDIGDLTGTSGRWGFWEGKMDEVRISYTGRIGEWIEASYNCMNSCDFTTLGTEEVNFPCVFMDQNRKTELRVNTDLGKFRFLGPGFDTGIVDADFMRVRDRGGNLYIDISHRESNATNFALWAHAICGPLDFCTAGVRKWSMVRLRFLLYDGWGVELDPV